MRTVTRTLCVLAASLATIILSVSAAEPAAFMGMDSCASSTCHGNVVGRGQEWNHSFSTWIANDPHANAGMVLRGKASRDIVHRLNPATIGSSVEFDNMLRTRCISCHTMTTATQCNPSGPIDDGLLESGVSCEACHGGAEKWIDSHVLTQWQGASRFTPQTGMLDTESIVGRAENCVRCHIGSRSADGLVRDMNHDLIASGHPPLRFDLVIYNENLPQHWSTTSESETRFRQSAIRTRGEGRLINLAAAAALASERAADHLKGVSIPWPELSDYDCFACHQSLSMDEYNLPPRGGLKSPLHVSAGLPVWNSWHSVNLLEIREQPDLLLRLAPHRSDPTLMVSSGRSLARKYRDLAAEQSERSLDPKVAIQSVADRIRTSPPVDWYQAAIVYLELDAAVRDLAIQSDPSVHQKQVTGLAEAEQILRFAPSNSVEPTSLYQSPSQFDIEHFRRAVLTAITAGN